MLGVVEDLVERPSSTTLPPYMTSTRSATSATTPRSWVIRIVARLRSRLRPSQQGEDLGLDRDVERRRRLVGDQHLGLQRQRHRDHRPLSHARRRTRAGSRRPASPAFGIPTESSSSMARDARLLSCSTVESMGADRLDDLAADPVDGVERGHRVLEDHPDPRRRGPHAARVRSRRAARRRAAAPSPRSPRWESG